MRNSSIPIPLVLPRQRAGAAQRRLPLDPERLGSPGALLCLALAALPGCAGERAEAPARPVHEIQGFSGPESVRYDPDQDVYFVSNIVGFGSVKDGNGYISRVSAADPRRVDTFVEGGRNGVTLHAPKGLAIQGDTLWVADIDVLRGFHRRTGAPVGAVDFRPHGALLLNDVVVGPDGAMRVTDSGIIMSPKGVLYPARGKILSVSNTDRSVTVEAEGAALAHPNGITWDSAGARWLVVTFHPFTSQVYALAGGDETPGVLSVGSGRFDGIEALPDGRILYTSWSDSSLHLIADGEDVRVVKEIWQPADLGVDTRRGRVAIPLVLQGRVQLWALPDR